MPSEPALLALAALAAGVGALGGLGGAVLLVPVLVLLDVPPADAAPLGLLTVAAGSIAAAPAQLRAGLVHHRLGLVMETGASAGAVLGALASGALGATALARILAAVALVAGLAGLRRGPTRLPPRPEFAAESAGEWPGTLGGAYRLGAEIVPYHARRTGLGWSAMVVAGAVSGLAGIGGGFIKAPAMRELMGVPLKVAAATSTFTVGITAASGLVVFAGQGRIDVQSAPPVVVGALAGGAVGAALADRVRPELLRRLLGLILVVVAAVVGLRG